MWSVENHPNLYPGDAAHWSPPVLASHTMGYTMWKEGELSSPGVEQVAETGATASIQTELNDSMDVLNVVVGRRTDNVVEQTQSFNSIQMTSANRFLSTVTMIAPR